MPGARLVGRPPAIGVGGARGFGAARGVLGIARSVQGEAQIKTGPGPAPRDPVVQGGQLLPPGRQVRLGLNHRCPGVQVFVGDTGQLVAVFAERPQRGLVHPGFDHSAAPVAADEPHRDLKPRVEFTPEVISHRAERTDRLGGDHLPLSGAVRKGYASHGPSHVEDPDLLMVCRGHSFGTTVGPTQGPLHVALAGGDPDLAQEHVADLHSRRTLDGQGLGPGGCRGGQLDLPAATRSRAGQDRLAAPTGPDRHPLPRVVPAPDRHDRLSLQDHVIAEDCWQSQLTRRGGRQSEPGRREQTKSWDHVQSSGRKGAQSCQARPGDPDRSSLRGRSSLWVQALMTAVPGPFPSRFGGSQTSRAGALHAPRPGRSASQTTTNRKPTRILRRQRDMRGRSRITSPSQLPGRLSPPLQGGRSLRRRISPIR